MKTAPVIFDLFHTLVDPDDFRPMGFCRLEASAAVLGVDYATLESEWNRSLPELVRGRDSVRGLMRRVAHGNGRPARTMDISPAAEPLGRYQDLALLHPRRQVLALLDSLEARQIGVLSNCHDRDIEAWRRSPIAKRVDHAVFSTKVHEAKPDVAAYVAILEEMGAAADEVVFVGNGGDNELAGAGIAGIGTVIHFAQFDDERGRISDVERQRRSAQADLTAATFEELAQLLNEGGVKY
ncbi:MAG: HAD family hydrolase [bacterium]|nr:HAD family hydrolase [bacterium]